MAIRRKLKILYAAAVAVLLAGCNSPNVSVSSDGSQVAVSSGGAVWVANVEKEAWTKLLVEGGSAESPTWSPDGHLVLLEIVPQPVEATPNDNSSTDSDSGYAALYSSDSKQIAKLASGAHAPFLWMADGQSFVASTISKDGEMEGLAWFDLSGAKQRSVVLPKKLSGISNLVVGHGTDVAFIAEREIGDDSVAGVYRTSGTRILTLAEHEGIAGLVYVPKGDGGELLWTAVKVDNQKVSMNLFQCDPNDGDIVSRPLLMRSGFIQAEPGAELSVESVTFAPNGSRIALVAKSTRESDGVDGKDVPPSDREACYSVETNGSGMHLIRQTNSGGRDMTPAWSADGRRLIVVQMNQQTPQLFVYNYDGTSKRLAPPPDEGAK